MVVTVVVFHGGTIETAGFSLNPKLNSTNTQIGLAFLTIPLGVWQKRRQPVKTTMISTGCDFNKPTE